LIMVTKKEMKQTIPILILTAFLLADCSNAQQITYNNNSNISNFKKNKNTNKQDITTYPLGVNQTPKEAFNAIRNVRGWCQKELKEVQTNSMMSLHIITKMYIAVK